ncbi:hypothetical protein [Nitratireductor basaltis]|uniref:Uncharacterized protein n=1 Tax=Nitratireductor basaltis TaxID=472175 RepID=A0A084UC13_9HYPH|nr:hypothetical protein [Nitratireductor basaltis]KFB10499.1 hypothetical protein EL18_01534 [Nitratireductor basaltis]
MITVENFYQLAALLGVQGQVDIAYSERIAAPTNAKDFAREAIWVICCSGMKYEIARLIERRVWSALRAGEPVAGVFAHRRKAAAMETIWSNREAFYEEFLVSNDKLAFCQSLPWIGKITRYHLAKSCGLDCAKPDVHLKRLADREGVTAQALCERLARETGLRVATIDLLLWRACATRLLDSRTGVIAA